MRVGIAADHGGFELKEQLVLRLSEAGYEIVDVGVTYIGTRCTPWSS